MAPNGEFFLRSLVRFDPANLWCCATAEYCSDPVSGVCPYGIDGAKFFYAFGTNGVSWVIETNPTSPDSFSGWHFFDNRSGATEHGEYFGSALAATNNDGEWHEWVWYFRHNTGSSGSWNADGVFEWYVDGSRAFRDADVPYSVDGWDGSFNRIDKPVTFFGGGGRLANDWWFWVDEIEIWRPVTP